jgi:cephalosporin hydroxylase
MDANDQFKNEVVQRIIEYANDEEFKNLAKSWITESMRRKYVYNFTWLGRPIIQYPEDIVALQEIIWETKPDLIIETGIAHGGSLIFSASMLQLIGGDGEVLGIDIDIRDHNKKEIENHPFSNRIKMLQGSSISSEIEEQVKAICKNKKRIMVCLDSNHTHEHVLRELEIYSKFVSMDCYLVVLDTFVEDMEKNFFEDRPWNVGNNPKTAVWEFLRKSPNFEMNKNIPQKLLITVAPDGFLKRVSLD